MRATEQPNVARIYKAVVLQLIYIDLASVDIVTFLLDVLYNDV